MVLLASAGCAKTGKLRMPGKAGALRMSDRIFSSFASGLSKQSSLEVEAVEENSRTDAPGSCLSACRLCSKEELRDGAADGVADGGCEPLDGSSSAVDCISSESPQAFAAQGNTKQAP